MNEVKLYQINHTVMNLGMWNIAKNKLNIIVKF